MRKAALLFLMLLLSGALLVGVSTPAHACDELTDGSDPLYNYVCGMVPHDPPPVQEEVEHLKDAAADTVFFAFCAVFPDHDACQD